MLYFDYCATTPLDERVAAWTADVNERVFGNPSSIHRFGQEARACVERARHQLATAINCAPSEIIFTSSGSEANNLPLWNVLHGEQKHVVLSAVEHPSVTLAVASLEKFGISATTIDVDSYGVVDPGGVARAVQRGETRLITVMMANNETGTVEPVQEIARIAAGAGVWFHSDGVQALGKVPVDVKQLNVTSMSFSAHKVYGPKGVGALYVKKGAVLHPHIIGGGQEQKMRGGTENVPGIAGFGLAVQIATELIEKEAVRLEYQKDIFLKKLATQIPDTVVNGHPEFHLPGVINISLPGVPADALLMNLDLDGMAVSSGSACSSGTTKPSRVLKAMGVSDELNLQTLRISFGRFTKQEDVETLADVMTRHVRKLSPEVQEAEA